MLHKKPVTVIEYNKGKASIDLADQKASYGNPLRRSLKWYRKVLVDILLNVSVVNASYIFNIVTESKMSITHFRYCLVESLIKKNEIVHSPLAEKHELVPVNRGRCYKCYIKTSADKGRKFAQSHSLKVKTKCIPCNKYLCLSCFNDTHRCALK
ncbi:piggyBac transposable element-derived protein 4-like [Sipha flava]|uniref:PiggyBac transposable element-derived protein 4-like n=1 Tax=Sipha flava TaxID=143950 RepID=A0A8B8FJF6_9HEMI|nr:piggyBac transposable element-derived protein 4-like [Sipha flava]